MKKDWNEQTKQEKFDTLTAYVKRLEKQIEMMTAEKEEMDMGRERNRLNDRIWATKEKLEKTQKRLKWYA